ncbi:MAG: pyrroloquinoline quinone biosynthesis protein PqqE [Rickettsiales bacterium]|nr:pyrroloquinoline quinone biosynthesis protein PqqE [Rickettsiales bacterium]
MIVDNTQTQTISGDTVVSLAEGVRLHRASVRHQFVLLIPEKALVLDDTGHAIIELMDGKRSLHALIQILAERYKVSSKDVETDVIEFVRKLDQHLCLAKKPLTALERTSKKDGTDSLPVALLAELTHRCPLACPYCSNPLLLKSKSDELTTQDWLRVFREARDLGVLHVHLSGGEPVVRPDLVEFVSALTHLGIYSNLITSGIGLTQQKVHALKNAGLGHLQLSLQGINAQSSDKIAGYKGGFEKKLQAIEWINDAEIPLTLNAVCHRHNMDDIADIIDMAVGLGARRLEIATVQFHGWAASNTMQLMPTQDQVSRAEALIKKARIKLRGTLVIDYVMADYYASYPKPCMGGWGRMGLNIDPAGNVLPCHAAETIPGLVFDNVKDKSLSEIWHNSDAFNAFRGDDWMQEPCRSCELKERDFGGCRCQALSIAGNASATDPVCFKSPHRHKIDATIHTVANTSDTSQPFHYRARA